MDIFWSKLKGVPAKCKWPVRVVDWGEEDDMVTVHCRCDDANFTVQRSQLVPFPGNLELMKKKGISVLKTRKSTIHAFLSDIDWAQEEIRHEVAPLQPQRSSLPFEHGLTSNLSSPDDDHIDLQEKTRPDDVTYPDIVNLLMEADPATQENSFFPSSDSSADIEIEIPPPPEFKKPPVLEIKSSFIDETVHRDPELETEQLDLKQQANFKEEQEYGEELPTQSLQLLREISGVPPTALQQVPMEMEHGDETEEDMEIGEQIGEQREKIQEENSDNENSEYSEKDDSVADPIYREESESSESDDDFEKVEDSNSDSDNSCVYPAIGKYLSPDDVIPEMTRTAKSPDTLTNPSPSDTSHFTSDTSPEMARVNERNNTCKLVRAISRDIPLSTNEIQRCVTYPKIFTRKYVQGSNEKSKSGRKYDLVHACMYCRKLRTNIQTHLFDIHHNERGVKDIKELQIAVKRCNSDEGKKKLRGLILTKQHILRNEGDNMHNTSVCHFKEGELLISRRREGHFDSRLYGGCPQCGQWILLRDNYTKHRLLCPCKSNSPLSTAAAVVQMMVFRGEIGNVSTPQMKEVFQSMKKDIIGLIAVKDDLIVALGEGHFFSSFGNKLKRKNYASFRMRLAARLLVLLRQELGNVDASMSECLVVENVDIFAKCALIECGENNDEELRHPSVALKIGDDLNKMVAAKIAFAAMSRDEPQRKEGKLFLTALARRWKLKVKKQATILLQERQFNKSMALPHPEDIATLAEFLINELKSTKLDKNIVTFREVVLLTEARLLLYNRRRPGELSSLEISTYRKRSTSVNETDLSLREELTPLEKHLLKSQELLEMRGKCNNRIPLLLPEEVKEPLKYLTDSSVREAVGINDGVYVFASTGVEPVRAGTALDVVKYRANLKYPERVLATNLRKHTATISQVMGLEDNELHWLVNHLGHSQKVHLQHYRATSGLIERIDVAKLMLLQEKNMVSRYAGLKLNEINFEDLDEEPVQNISQTPQTVDVNTDIHADGLDEIESEEVAEERTMKKRKSVKRVTWTNSEMDEIREYFKEFLVQNQEKKCPRMKHCLYAISCSKAKGGQLCKRNWETLKKKVNHMITNMRKNIV